MTTKDSIKNSLKVLISMGAPTPKLLTKVNAFVKQAEPELAMNTLELSKKRLLLLKKQIGGTIYWHDFQPTFSGDAFLSSLTGPTSIYAFSNQEVLEPTIYPCGEEQCPDEALETWAWLGEDLEVAVKG